MPEITIDEQKRKEIEELLSKDIDELYCMLGEYVNKKEVNTNDIP